MSTTNIADKRPERISKTNFKASLSRLKLVNSTLDRTSWKDMYRELRKLRELGCIKGRNVGTILARFPEALPEVLLRQDRGLWEVSIFFEAQGCFFFLAMSANANIQLRAIIDGEDLRSDHYIDTPMVSFIFREMERTISEGQSSKIARETYLALWVARGYDTLQRIAQVRQIRDKYGPDFDPTLAIQETGNLLDPSDAFPFFEKFEKITDPGSWRVCLPVQFNLIECLKYDWKTQNDFHSEII